jgi:hypothetical protein
MSAHPLTDLASEVVCDRKLRIDRPVTLFGRSARERTHSAEQVGKLYCSALSAGHIIHTHVCVQECCDSTDVVQMSSSLQEEVDGWVTAHEASPLVITRQFTHV